MALTDPTVSAGPTRNRRLIRGSLQGGPAPRGGMNPSVGRGPGMNPALGRGPGLNPTVGRGPGMNPSVGRGPGLNPALGRGPGLNPSVGRGPGMNPSVGRGPGMNPIPRNGEFPGYGRPNMGIPGGIGSLAPGEPHPGNIGGPLKPGTPGWYPGMYTGPGGIPQDTPYRGGGFHSTMPTIPGNGGNVGPIDPRQLPGRGRGPFGPILPNRPGGRIPGYTPGMIRPPQLTPELLQQMAARRLGG